MTITPYINMAGNAEEAVNFYKSVFGGEADIMRWKDMPPNPEMPVDEGWNEKIMHATLTLANGLKIFLADSLPEGAEGKGNNVFIHVEFDSEDELRNAFEALSAGGKINMPLDKMFWGAYYGDFIDKFGVGWGMHYQLPE